MPKCRACRSRPCGRPASHAVAPGRRDRPRRSCSSATSGTGQESGPMPPPRQPEPQRPSDDTQVADMQALNGPPTPITCPACGGALWESHRSRRRPLRLPRRPSVRAGQPAGRARRGGRTGAVDRRPRPRAACRAAAAHVGAGRGCRHAAGRGRLRRGRPRLPHPGAGDPAAGVRSARSRRGRAAAVTRAPEGPGAIDWRPRPRAAPCQEEEARPAPARDQAASPDGNEGARRRGAHARPRDAAGARPHRGRRRRSSPCSRSIGVGASAGGLEAFSQLLRAVPRAQDLALVFVQHLSPHHESALAVAAVGADVAAGGAGDRRHAGRAGSRLRHPAERADGDARRRAAPARRGPAIESQLHADRRLLRSLAEAARERGDRRGAVGHGVRRRRRHARHQGRRRHHLRPGARIGEVRRHAARRDRDRHGRSGADAAGDRRRAGRRSPATSACRPTPLGRRPRRIAPTSSCSAIFDVLRPVSGVDFRHYKLPTIQRRLLRRMALHRLDATSTHYLQLLESDSGEVRSLYQDLLIHVTRFFRDPESFDGARRRRCSRRSSRTAPATSRSASGCPAAPPARRPTRSPSRCSSSCGDDARGRARPDLRHRRQRERDRARPRRRLSGEHRRRRLAERLRRFFTQVDGGYRITKTVRDLCVFARQDLTRDPPFSQLDLIVCRNVLIYLDTGAAARS